MKNRGYDEEQAFITQNKVHYLGLCTSRKSRVTGIWLFCRRAYFLYENIVIAVAGSLLHCLLLMNLDGMTIVALPDSPPPSTPISSPNEGAETKFEQEKFIDRKGHLRSIPAE